MNFTPKQCDVYFKNNKYYAIRVPHSAYTMNYISFALKNSDYTLPDINSLYVCESNKSDVHLSDSDFSSPFTKDIRFLGKEFVIPIGQIIVDIAYPKNMKYLYKAIEDLGTTEIKLPGLKIVEPDGERNWVANWDISDPTEALLSIFIGLEEHLNKYFKPPISSFFSFHIVNSALEYISSPDSDESLSGRDIIKKELKDIGHIATQACDFLKCIVDECNTSTLKTKFLNFIDKQHISFRASILNDSFTSIYSIGDLKSWIAFEICNIINNKISVKKCNNCNNFFIPINRSDTLYCDRISPQDPSKTCKEYGAINTYNKNLKDSLSRSLYRKIYMSKQMLAKRNPDVFEYKESFEKYKQHSKQWKADIKAGVKTEEEFIAWLKEVKEKKVL